MSFALLSILSKPPPLIGQARKMVEPAEVMSTKPLIESKITENGENSARSSSSSTELKSTSVTTENKEIPRSSSLTVLASILSKPPPLIGSMKSDRSMKESVSVSEPLRSAVDKLCPADIVSVSPSVSLVNLLSKPPALIGGSIKQATSRGPVGTTSNIDSVGTIPNTSFVGTTPNTGSVGQTSTNKLYDGPVKQASSSESTESMGGAGVSSSLHDGDSLSKKQLKRLKKGKGLWVHKNNKNRKTDSNSDAVDTKATNIVTAASATSTVSASAHTNAGTTNIRSNADSNHNKNKSSPERSRRHKKGKQKRQYIDYDGGATEEENHEWLKISPPKFKAVQGSRSEAGLAQNSRSEMGPAHSSRSVLSYEELSKANGYLMNNRKDLKRKRMEELGLSHMNIVQKNEELVVNNGLCGESNYLEQQSGAIHQHSINQQQLQAKQQQSGNLQQNLQQQPNRQHSYRQQHNQHGQRMQAKQQQKSQQWPIQHHIKQQQQHLKQPQNTALQQQHWKPTAGEHLVPTNQTTTNASAPNTNLPSNSWPTDPESLPSVDLFSSVGSCFIDPTVMVTEKKQKLDDEVKPEKGPRVLSAGKLRKKKMKADLYFEKQRKKELEAAKRVVKKPEPIRCKFFMLGRCTNDPCTFSHDYVPDRIAEVCKFYITDSCFKGKECLYYHNDWPCKFYHKFKKCVNADRCKFSHAELTPEMRDLLEKSLAGESSVGSLVVSSVANSAPSKGIASQNIVSASTCPLPNGGQLALNDHGNGKYNNYSCQGQFSGETNRPLSNGSGLSNNTNGGLNGFANVLPNNTNGHLVYNNSIYANGQSCANISNQYVNPLVPYKLTHVDLAAEHKPCVPSNISTSSFMQGHDPRMTRYGKLLPVSGSGFENAGSTRLYVQPAVGDPTEGKPMCLAEQPVDIPLERSIIINFYGSGL